MDRETFCLSQKWVTFYFSYPVSDGIRYCRVAYSSSSGNQLVYNEITLAMCAMQCHQTPNCTSFNYNSPSCELQTGSTGRAQWHPSNCLITRRYLVCSFTVKLQHFLMFHIWPLYNSIWGFVSLLLVRRLSYFLSAFCDCLCLVTMTLAKRLSTIAFTLYF